MEAFDDKFPLGLTPDMLGSLEPPKMPCEIPYSQDMAKLGNRLIEQISMLRVQLEDVDDTNAHCILLDGVLNELRAHVTAGDSGFIELDIAELAPGFVFIVSTLPRNAPQTLLDQLNEVLATLDEHKAKYKNQLFRISLTGEQEDLDILAETLGDELSIIAEEYLAKKAAQYNFTRGSLPQLPGTGYNPPLETGLRSTKDVPPGFEVNRSVRVLRLGMADLASLEADKLFPPLDEQDE